MDLDDGQVETAAGTSSARLGRTLIVAGFVPFAALAFWLYGIAPDHPWRHGTIVLLTAYGAVAGRDDGPRRDLILGIVPPLVGWAAILVPVPLAFVLLAVAFAARGIR